MTTISRDGDRRDLAIAHGLRQGLLLRIAGAPAHLVVVAVAARMAGGDGGEHFRGGRSTGTDSLGATTRFEANGWGLRLPEEALSTPTCSGAACGCCNRGGDMAGGGERSALVVDAARGRITQ